MKLGIYTIYLALIATAFSAFHYWRLSRLESNNPKNENLISRQDLARTGFYIMTFFVVAASIYLWYLIFTHQFQVKYIYSYTSRDLGLGYLISAFWAGQEGSFLFWTLMIAIMGVWFMRKAGKLESYSMFFINLVQAAFLILLIIASPFAVQSATPPDGAGLNPLLQNPWMVIHPPILFLGYAATTIPFVIGLSALLKEDFSNWVKMALPWTLFASVSMGAGIIIGGYWAYKVLGWGGYWGWDPVENSSLIAWLTVLALFHGLIVTRIKGGLQKTNFVLTVLSFSLVLYATFLTRSGVLADFSVHSFQDLGINVYLTFYMILVFAGGLLLVFAKRKKLPFVKIDFSVLSKEQILVYTVQILLLSTLLVLIGTSSPLITKIYGDPGQVDISFYNTVNQPIAVIISILLGLAPLLGWREDETKELLKKLIPSIVVAVNSAGIAIYFGMSGFLNILFTASIMLAFTSSLIVVIQRIKQGWRFIIAPLSHLGVTMMFAGIIISAVFNESERGTITQGIPGTILGNELTYMEDFNSPDGKNGLKIQVKNGNSTYIADPRLYMNDYSRSVMSEPFVKEGLFNDTYISLLQKMDGKSTNPNSIVIQKGQQKDFSDYKILFKGYEMGQDPETKEFSVSAVLDIEKDGKSIEVKPALLMQGEHRHSQPAELTGIEPEGTKISVSLVSMSVEDKMVELSFIGIDPGPQAMQADQIVVEVSHKPFMGIMWIGTIILTLGTLLAMRKRNEELKLLRNTPEKKAAQNVCPKCKTDNDLNAKFCRECGAKLKVNKKKVS
ncbi:MAG: cytochrome c biogenesis protein CcsA [Calditrichae bacterium]|nr:cytochrome c biogenesis protein CcsA [Calditrichota bacterium]MCB9058760.1 cytochrome c biogenesis protein CcsA [Calditrichia bacterium]